MALRFDVIDMGIGIAPDDQERLFRAFAQADSSTTRKFGGTGLGLAICRQLVELMGGTLGLISAPGEGLDVLVRAVACAAPRASNRTQPPDEPRSLAGRRALVVDDNATNRRILRQQLLSWGVERRRGRRRLPGARAARPPPPKPARRFDLGVIDLNMPGMDGIELAQHAEGGPGDRGDHAVPAQLLRRTARRGRVASAGLRRQPDQAGPLVGAVRLPDHQPQRRSQPPPAATRTGDRANPRPWR